MTKLDLLTLVLLALATGTIAGYILKTLEVTQ